MLVGFVLGPFCCCDVLVLLCCVLALLYTVFVKALCVVQVKLLLTLVL